jgi:hypothetical protein
VLVQFVFFMTLPGLVVLLTALKERQSALVMRDGEEDGAPPWSTVGLRAGTAVIRLNTNPPPRKTPWARP